MKYNNFIFKPHDLMKDEDLRKWENIWKISKLGGYSLLSGKKLSQLLKKYAEADIKVL